MPLSYIPLLQIQRDLHRIPRGKDRFLQYLHTILSDDGTDVELAPLVAANPMAKDHVTDLLDTILAMDADAIAARATSAAAACIAELPGEWSAAVIVADDLLGGGTNRYDYEFDFRFGPEKLRQRKPKHPKRPKRAWITAVLWSSEQPTELAVRLAIWTAVYRAAYTHQHGPVRTLADMLAQEGRVMAMAGCTTPVATAPVLDKEELEYTRAVLAPYLEAGDKRTAIECLFGDEAAGSLGFTTRGLSPWAGLSLALHDARCTSWFDDLLAGQLIVDIPECRNDQQHCRNKN